MKTRERELNMDEVIFSQQQNPNTFSGETVIGGKTPLHSYSKIYHLGHRALQDLLVGNVVVEEKVDGSQFTFGVRNGELHFRSRGATIYPENAPNLFKPAVDYIVSIKHLLVDGWTFRGEAMCKPRHNTLTYGRVPKHNVVIFDIETSDGQHFLLPEMKKAIAADLDLETVPVFHVGANLDFAGLKNVMEGESFLGGAKMEGVVIKNYERFDEDKKVLMGKWVREEFKEIHQGAWKAANPSRSDVIEAMVKVYRNENRWIKAVQHLRDQGLLKDAPSDIGLLVREFQTDLLAESGEEMKEKLFEFASPKILRGASSGLAEWYKATLANKQFESKGV